MRYAFNFATLYLMSLKEKIDADLKAALLSGDKPQVMTLRGLKSVVLNAEIEAGKRDQGLSDDEIIGVLRKEAKKRQESADLYRQGGNPDKADAELAEKRLIESYLPAPMSDEDIGMAVDEAIASTNAQGMQAMSQVVGLVKKKLGPAADGSVIARIAKEKLS